MLPHGISCETRSQMGDTGLVWERRRRVETGLQGRIGGFTEQDRIMQKTLDVTMRIGEAHENFPLWF